MTAPVDTNFVSGTTITSNWLNGVNDAINNSTQDISGSVPRTILKKVSDNISVKDFGATGDGRTNDSAKIAVAHSKSGGNAVRYPYQAGEVYIGADTKYNLYGNSIHTKAIGEYIQAGRPVSPTDKAQPILWVQKVSSANRDTVPANWDQVGYFGLIKKSGDAYGAALTGYNLTQGGSGDSIGIHGRVDTRTNGSRTYAGWFYSVVGAGVTPYAAHALELNGYNAGVDLGYLGKAQLLRVCMADSSASANRFSTGISVGWTTVGGDNGFYTGLHFERGSIIRSTGADNEAIRVDAPASGPGSIGGFRFAKFDAGDAGVFKYALRTDEATFSNNNVLLMATGQGIRWGNESTGVRFFGGLNNIVLGNGFLNITNPVSDTAIQVASTKVLGARKTGWESATGTATRTTFATSTVTTAQLAEHVKALLDDLISHGLIGT